ncbi:MAG: TonB-dependent receptor [Saprospiraceae bacterium]
MMFSTHLIAQTCQSTLSGQVLDADSGKPIPFVSITIDSTDFAAISDENGNYKIDGLCKRVYSLYCSHIDCEHLAQEIAIEGAQVHKVLYLHHHEDGILLQDLVVTGQANRISHIGAVADVAKEDLFQYQGKSFAETMSKIPGVSFLKTGSDVVKPVIQGLHSSRIVIITNGVRLEGQQWGIEHAPEVDPFVADEIQVIKGANSVQYGSSAMSGVVVMDSKPLPAQPGLHGGLNLLGNSNGRSGLVSAYLEGKLKGKFPLSGRIQGTIKRGGNVSSPDYFLANTGHQEENFSYSIGLKSDFPLKAELFYSQFNMRQGIFRGSHIGNSVDLQNAIERTEPFPVAEFSYHIGRPYQYVNHELLRAKVLWNISRHQKMELVYSRQYNKRQEYEYHKPGGIYEDDDPTPQQKLEITTHTVDLNMSHHLSKDISGKVGIFGMRQNNTVDRGKLIPAFTLNNGAIYWVERWHQDLLPLDVEAGLRYDYMQQEMQVFGLDQSDIRKYNQFSGNLGLSYYSSAVSRFSLNIGSGWRAPAPNELYANDVHNGIGTFEKGNPLLESERNLNLNLSFTYGKAPFDLSINVYHNRFSHFIYQYVEGEPTLTIGGSFITTSFAQADAALSGLDAQGSYEINQHFKANLRTSILYARNLELRDWLPLMPANRLSGGLQWEGKASGKWEKPKLGIDLVQVFEQNHVPVINADPLDPPGAYFLANLNASWDLKLAKERSLQFGLSLDNMLNNRYRDYLNRFRYFADELGFNASGRITFHF